MIRILGTQWQQSITQGTSAAFATIASQFVSESIAHMIPWLIVTAVIIIADLIAGIRKSLFLDEKISVSSAIRRTMGKMVTYFAFVVMIVMINEASDTAIAIDKWACLTVAIIEASSVFSNIMKTKGIDFNVFRFLILLFSKKTGTEKKEIEEIIKESTASENSDTDK